MCGSRTLPDQNGVIGGGLIDWSYGKESELKHTLGVDIP